MENLEVFSIINISNGYQLIIYNHLNFLVNLLLNWRKKRYSCVLLLTLKKWVNKHIFIQLCKLNSYISYLNGFWKVSLSFGVITLKIFLKAVSFKIQGVFYEKSQFFRWNKKNHWIKPVILIENDFLNISNKDNFIISYLT